MPQPLIERYREYIPLEPGDPIVSINEGSTPLVPAPRLSERIGANVFLKIEGANPTVSFKDRGMTVAVSRAKGRGAEAVICASTGNTAASAAAYAVRAGLTGAVIAALQLPQLLADWVGVDKTVTDALTTAPTELGAAAVNQLSTAALSNPMWLAIAAGAALCVFAVSTFERA